MSASARADMSAHDVCKHCYLYFHYNWGYEYPLSWNVDRYGETVNSWAEQGYRVHDGVDRNTNTDTGYTVFSKQPCETCGDHLAGERYRLLVG